jgi:signal transduction histidine kinase
MTFNFTHFSIKRQVIILFVILALIITGFGIFNYLTLKNYDDSIRQIRDSIIKKLSIIGEVSINAGAMQSEILQYLYADEPLEKQLQAKKIMEQIEQNELLFDNLFKLIQRDETEEDLSLVLRAEKAYVKKIIETIETPDPLPATDPFRYEQSEIRFLFDAYFTVLQNFSSVIISDAEEEIAAAVGRVNRARLIGYLFIIGGILILLINSYFILKIYKGLSRDYFSLKMERAEKIKAEEELEKLNQQLEEKIEDRTRELEDANKEISVYNSELKKLSLAKDKFISVISHDLRNPISTILSSSEALIELTGKENIDKEELTQFSRIINSASSKVMTQLNELVEWAKNKRISKIYNPVELNLWEAINESLQLLESLSKQNDVRLENNVSPTLFINADKMMFRSIIQNLVTNSIKFTPATGVVSIDAKVMGEMIEIRVKDTGLGMKEEVKENLFKEKLPMSNEKSQKTGMGLELVKYFVEKHHGTIRVESEVGKGSLFVFTIPAANVK